MPSSSDPLSEAIECAFRAAMLLTGDVLLAEDAITGTIARLEVSRDIRTELLAATVEVLVRRAGYEDQVTRTLTNLPHKLQRLHVLDPMPRDCFLQRTLFNIPAARCAGILSSSDRGLRTIALHAAGAVTSPWAG